MSPPYLDVFRANGLGSANASQISLNTVHDRAPLISPATPSYGATFPASPTRSKTNSRRLIVNAVLKMATIFLISSLLLGGILWIALPVLEEEDRDKLRVPRSFESLKELNTLLKKYRDIYPYRIVICYMITYLFLQAFSLPGSMYLSIIGGAVWGMPRALPLVCICVATGASLCYFISAALGPALLTLPRFKVRLDQVGEKIRSNKDNMISFLIVLRISPLPPHWVLNIVCPHVGVDIVRFWISTALGILGVSVIHTSIGGSLDNMTSPADFKLISWTNFFGLAAIAVGVMIPVGLRWWFKPQVVEIALPDSDEEEVHHLMDIDDPAGHPRPPRISDRREAMFEDEDSSDEDDDIVLEGGPTMGR